jgi:phospholipase C
VSWSSVNVPDQTTIFDWLKRKGKDYRLYVDAKPIYDKIAPTNLLLMDNQWEHLVNAHTLDTLQGHWASAEPAPAVIYCEPFYNDFATALGLHGNCNHCPLPIAFGEDFLKRVYIALTSNPQKWQRTMLVLCYDEHGGFFDHVRPPQMVYAQPEGNTWSTKTPFQTLGVRIPALVISPWVKPPSCFSGLLDHTSILQLMVDKFGQPGDLQYFGDAAARKASGVQSLAESLTGTSASADILELPDPPVVSAGATTPPVTNLGNLFRRAITILKEKV